MAPGTGRQSHVLCCLLACLCVASDLPFAYESGVWLSVPRDGAIFRPGEHVRLIFQRATHTPQAHWQRVSVAVWFDDDPLGVFAFPSANRSLELALGAAPDGRHVVRAQVDARIVAHITLHVGTGQLALHAGEKGLSNGASRRVELDHWGCLLLGGTVSSLPGISGVRPLHLWLNGERLRTDEGWLVARLPPGSLHVRGAVVDDWGDVALENHTTLDVVLPDRPLMGHVPPHMLHMRQRTLDYYLHYPLPSFAHAAGGGGGGSGGGEGRRVISCLHPTRARPMEALETRARWLAAATVHAVLVFAVCFSVRAHALCVVLPLFGAALSAPHAAHASCCRQSLLRCNGVSDTAPHWT